MGAQAKYEYERNTDLKIVSDRKEDITLLKKVGATDKQEQTTTQLRTLTSQQETLTGEGISSGDFKEIFDTIYEPLKHFIYYKSGNIIEAEDIAQEAFMKVWEKRNEVKKATVKAYLYTIAGNICINRHLQKKVVLKFENAQKRENHSANSPEFDLEMKEFNQQLQTAISNLSEKNREVFLMNRIDDMTYNEIASNLDISVKAVEKRMKNALSSLRKLIVTKF